mgnify:CR=1 FL=1
MFVGNLSKNVDPREFEKKFQQYGNVNVDKRVKL